ncbi:alpha/beta hydrolase [Streptacidiphilus jiangxiensis]|uniref:Enterochelin esterase n=1 Tax=Streptacidiphilus jiangxiensis TaxID=235985 RepID=A0A1H7JWB5_STRJI|nr:alpha/beta fold hydrolase [Streptacidiphilus jiangxiensis]SEK78792.1 Enterochelin esterase [Streptacidiphilus jiangxiensis]
MSLTGTPFFVVTLVVMLAAMVLLAVVWNRIPGPRPLRFAGRMGATMFSQVAAVVVVLVYVNNTMGPFYESWQDLFGEDANQSATATDQGGGSATGISGPAGEKLTFKTYLPGVKTTVAHGPASGITGSLYVWLPPQYDDPAYAHTSFPVVELLPGTPGTPQAWFGSMKVQNTIEPLMAAGKVKPVILVAAKLNVIPGGVDPGCADVPGPGGARTATWLDKDVPDLIAANFRTAKGPRHWGIMGYSAGGYCAVNLTVQHPGRYHAAVSLSGYNAPDSPLVTSNPALDKANNPFLLLKQEKHQPDIAVLAAGSLQDPGTVPAAKALLSVLHTPGPNQLLTVRFGGHTTDVWRTMLPDALIWLSARLG